MIDIIRSLFLQLNFSIEPQENLPAGSLFASYNSSQKEEYFFVLTVTHISQLKGDGEDPDQNLGGLVSAWKNVYPGVAKNTSLLVLWQALSEEEVENCKKLIFELEEDPYDFKKYVLFYTEPELLAFRNKFPDPEYKLDILQAELNNSGSFIAFKSYLKSKNSSSEATFLFYSLLSRIFIKVPILRTTNRHRELYDLQSSINARVSQRGLAGLQQKVLELEASELEENPIDDLINMLFD